jgi:hypothetical protein
MALKNEDRVRHLNSKYEKINNTELFLETKDRKVLSYAPKHTICSMMHIQPVPVPCFG